PARLIFEEFAADAFALPHDDEWLLSSIMLTEVCTALSDVPRAAVLYDLLLPHAQSVASFWNEASVGSVDRYLGLLCTITSRWKEAALHFEAALEMNEHLGARPWL